MITYEFHRSGQPGYLYQQIDSNFNFPAHMHKSLEFLTVEEGMMRCQIGPDTWDIHAGECALILPDQLHSYETPGTSKSKLWVFSEDYVPDFCAWIQGYRFQRPVFQMHTEDLVERLSPDENIYLHKATLYHICGMAVRCCDLVADIRKQDYLPARIIGYIQDNYTQDLSLKVMARELGYSYSYLSSFFNQTLHMGFGAFVNQYRIAYAEGLLRSTRMTMTEIAEASGFATIRSFNREFLRNKGVSPSTFRKENQQEHTTDAPSIQPGTAGKRPLP